MRHGQLVDASHGTMEFAWESGGSTRARTLVVQQFRGVLSRSRTRTVVQFEKTGEVSFDAAVARCNRDIEHLAELLCREQRERCCVVASTLGI